MEKPGFKESGLPTPTVPMAARRVTRSMPIP
jgi:hypothetical protein